MRLFLAIPIPYDIALYLKRFSHGLQNCQWVDPLQMHITLTFLGECSDDTIQSIEEALQNIYVPPFQLTLSGTGFFPSKKEGGTLWAGLEKSEALITLQQLITNTLLQEGFKMDKGEYKPHITLGRVNGKYKEIELTSFLENGVFLTHDPFIVDNYSLFSSKLLPDGPRYREEITFSLQ